MAVRVGLAGPKLKTQKRTSSTRTPCLLQGSNCNRDLYLINAKSHFNLSLALLRRISVKTRGAYGPRPPALGVGDLEDC